MPYNIINPGSVEDAWNNPQSVFNQAQDNDRQTQAVQQQGLLNQTVQNYGNVAAPVVQNAVETPAVQSTVPSAATQMAAQGNTVARRRPTAAEYEAGVINYLVNNRGYSYEDAQQLMAPRIQAYKVQEAAENRNMADNLIASMQNMRIDSPEYRQAAFQLYRLDPQMGTYMLKEGVSPRDLYTRNMKLYDQNLAMQQRKELAKYNSDLQLDNYMRRLGITEARQQQQIATNFQRYKAAGLDDQTAMLYALGATTGRRGGAAVPGATGVSDKDYKRATEELKALDDEIAEGMLTNPNFQLSPQKQQMYNMLYAVKQRGDNEFFARNGVGQQKQQPTKINFNDYNSLKPALQRLVQRNGGKFSKDIARLVRQRAGLDPDNNNPNEFLNIIFKKDYGFSG